MYSNESLTDPNRQPDLNQVWVENFTTIYDIRNDLMRRMEANGPEALSSNVLNSVGVGDFNKALDLLDPETQLLIKPAIYLYDVAQSVKPKYLTILKERQSRMKFDFEDHRFPIFDGGMVDKIASTELFRRLSGINQINMVEWYPMRNEQTRSSHSINTTVYMLRALQSICDKDKPVLVDRLQSDFSEYGIDIQGVDDDSLVELAARLTAATGMLHDVFTPAGGDIIKRAVGMNEEEDIELLLTSRDNRVEEVRNVLADFGVEGDLLEFVISCVKGESGSLVGDMIHPSDNTNILDIDQIAYTLWDAKEAGIIKEPALLRDNSVKLGTNQQSGLLEGVDWAEYILCDVQYPGAGAGRLVSNELLPLSDLDPIEGYGLSDDGRLVNERPGIVSAVIALRIFMSAELYRGTKMGGYDKDLETTLRQMIDSGGYDEILSKENLLQITTKELIEQLANTTSNFDDESPFKTFADTWKLKRYSSEIVNASEHEPGIQEGIRFGFRTGLDTQVCNDDGLVISLRDYLDDLKKRGEDAEEPIVGLIDKLTSRYNKDTMRVVSSRFVKQNKYGQILESDQL